MTTTWHLTWQEQLGSAVFFYALIPALIIYGIGLIVANTIKDDEEARQRRTVRAWAADWFADPDPRATADRTAMLKARAR